MLKRGIHFWLVSLLCLVLGGPLAFAQISDASLTGRITDATGSVIPQATVTATNTATNIQRRTTTDTAGYYNFPSLPIGLYTVAVTRKGFTQAQQAVELQVGQRARLNATLQIGSQTQTVEVAASNTPLLQTDQATVGTVVNNHLISTLPLSNRTWDDLMLTVPGVQGTRYTEETGGTASGRTGNVNVNGVNSLQNNFLLDGVDNNSISENVQELTTQVVRPSVDAIQEFRVDTDPYSAEFGRSPGAAISVNTKGGTNQFHSTLYEYLRNNVFDSRDYFQRQKNVTKPLHIQNQYGVDLGGPLVKDKLFFFVNYEGTKIREGQTRLSSIPTSNERNGDFSLAAAAGNNIKGGAYGTVIDPTTGLPFPNNQIPANRMDPVALNVLSLLPLPNATPSSGPANVNNYLITPKLQDDTDNYFARLDGQINSNNNVFVRFNDVHRARFVPGYIGGVLDGTGTSAWGKLWMNAYSAALGWNTTLSANLVNEFRFGWGRNVSFGAQYPYGSNTLASLGFKGIPDSAIYSGGVPGLSFSGGGGVNVPYLGSPDYLPKFQYTNQFEWTDMLDVQLGSHQIKTGVDFHAPMRNIYLDLAAMRGHMDFTGQFTGNSFADFLLGYVGGAQESVYHQVDQRLWMASGFVQDDWKFSPRLTVNLGLRYDFATWPMEANNQLANFNPATGQLMQAGSGSLASRTLVQPDKNDWAPRIGLEYQLNDKTVLRSGYGRFFELFERHGSEDQLALNPPYLINVSAAAPRNSNTPLFYLQDGFPASYRQPPSLNDLTKIHVRAANPNNVDSTIDQWSLGLQRTLPYDSVLTMDYVGTKGTHLGILESLNEPTPVGAASAQAPYPNFGYIEYRNNVADSVYHSLQVSAQKRFSRGLTAQIAYTWSHSIDDAMDYPQDATHFYYDRGSSDFDVRHRFVASYSYDLPFGHGHGLASGGIAAAVFGGWRAAGIFTKQSGRPFKATWNPNNSLLAGQAVSGVTAFASVVGNGNLPSDQRDPSHWINTAAFVNPGKGLPGNAGRNTLAGPGYTDMDFSLSRIFQLSERRSAEFRWETFNLFNTPQFGQPNGNASSGSFGVISSLAGDPRVMQFALRVNF